MRKLITILLLSVPVLTWAQLSAPADYIQPTTGLTGKYDYVYVFYGQNLMSIKAAQPQGHTAEFTWKKLNVADTTLDLYHQESGVSSSTINNLAEGGYQVAVRDLDELSAPVDTFTTWVFRDTFRINDIQYTIDCDVLRLNMYTTPNIYAPYTIYNFKQFLNPPHAGETVFSQVQKVKWTPVDASGQEINIFPNVTNPDEHWRERLNWFTYVDSPPPLKDAAYHLEVRDVFGNSATYTTPYTIKAIAAKAIPTIQEEEKGLWQDAGEQPQGEALYKVRFQHNKSANVTQYEWKGFANARQLNGDKTILWAEATTDAEAYIYPQVPYNGQLYDGYTPGSYQVRLTVRNNVCIDSVSVKYIIVDPSKFDAQAIPNAFTPNGDNQNDIFTFVKGNEPVSLEYIYVYIYNRSGGLVYRYEGRSDAWEGWNGRMMGTGSDVSDGVYYYVISGKGWDDVTYNSKEYSGYLHLFR